MNTEDVKRQASEWQQSRDQMQNEHETVVRGLHRLMNFKVSFQRERHRISHYIAGNANQEWDSAVDPLVVEFTAHEARVEKVFELIYGDLKDFLSNVYEDEPSTSTDKTIAEAADESDEETALEVSIPDGDIGSSASHLVAERLQLQEMLKKDYDRLEAVMKKLNSHRASLERNRTEFTKLNSRFCEREAELGAKIEHTISARPSSQLAKPQAEAPIAEVPRRKWYRR